MRLLPFAAAAIVLAAPLSAQQGPLRAPLSTRVTFTLPLNPPRAEGAPAPAPLVVSIEYGQPHARGRAVPAELSTDGTVWRTGANSSTTLKTAADLVIGGTRIPAGAYSLYTIRENGAYKLIVNANTGQWGTSYEASRDVARIPLRARTLHEAQESLQITMVPADAPTARGVLTIRWGTLELAADWSTP
ncbi:MAG: DUF2911 domain-containing protein [Gemmatimonadaceae bacterium]|nr:DUF2911 domain-containing protein [Gemmatimonadaceae bacterium]